MAENLSNSSLPPADPQIIAPGKAPKRNNKHHNKANHQHTQQFDGSVSDSVAIPITSPKPKKGYKNQQQNVAPTTIPKENNQAGKARPVSIGGGMLPGTPAKEQAYAGPTFQASPAASALPIPKFLSRSVPNVAAQQQSLGARMAGEKTPEAERSSPESDAVVPTRQTQSPLDMFFKADREEKQRSASMQSPELHTTQAVPVTEPRNPFNQQRKSIFLQEMDGGTDMPIPKSVPHGRPFPPQRVHSSDSSSPFLQSDADRERATKSLKDMLFNVNPTSPNSTPARPSSNPRNGNSPYSTPSPFQRAASGPSTPTPNAEQQYNYALHYGNRNLSPMFKAARNDTPPSRPSGLRQQAFASDVPNQSAGPFPPPPQSQQQIDPNSFFRNYLDQQIRANQPPTMPPIRLANGTLSSPPLAPQNGVVNQQGVSGGSPRTTNGNRNTLSGQEGNKNFEDDLRRMLNLNVLSN